MKKFNHSLGSIKNIKFRNDDNKQYEIREDGGRKPRFNKPQGERTG